MAARLRETHPEIGVVVLSQYADPDYVLDAARRRAPTGAATCSRSACTTAAQLRLRDRDRGRGRLGDRPQDRGGAGAREGARGALAAVASSPRASARCWPRSPQGKSNTAIAESLVLTKRAVEKHINSIFLKLGLAGADDVSKRVKATLLFLAEPTDERRASQARGGRLCALTPARAIARAARCRRFGLTHERGIRATAHPAAGPRLPGDAARLRRRSSRVWANRQLLNTDNWTETSSELLENEEIRTQIAGFLVDELYANVDVEAQIREALPPRAAAARRAGRRRAEGGGRARHHAAAGQAACPGALGAGEPRAHTAASRRRRGGGHRRAEHRRRERDARPQGAAHPDAGACRASAAAWPTSCPADAAQLTVLKSDQLGLAQDIVDFFEKFVVVIVLLALRPVRARRLPRARLAPRGAACLRRGLRGRRGRRAARTLAGRRRRGRRAGHDGGRQSPPSRPPGRSPRRCSRRPPRRCSATASCCCWPPGWPGPSQWAVSVRRWLAPYLREPRLAYGGMAAIVLLVLAWGPTPATR